jgi:hypothetical protein
MYKPTLKAAFLGEFMMSIPYAFVAQELLVLGGFSQIDKTKNKEF